MATQLSNTFSQGYINRGNLDRVKNNTPFGYYDNDSEFIKDAQRAAAFVAQRLGVGGASNQTSIVYITELTVYAAMEEAVTTYGNMVYQYRIRDQYLNFEGAQTLPFNQTETADKIVLSQDPSINSTVFWSDSRTATWGEIEFDLPNSSSAAGGEIYVMSSSLNDYLAPDVKKVKNWNMFYYQDSDPAQGVPTDYDWSQTTYPQFNKIAGPTIATTNYSSSFTVFNTNDLAIFTSTPGSSSFSVTGSNGNKALFIVTASVTPSDSLDTFYITTGSNANETANNIANKFNSVSSNFGLIVTANTGSTPVQLDLTSSIGVINPVGSGFEINWLDNLNNPAQTTFTSAPNTYLTYQITEGESWVYFFTGYKKQDYFPNNTPYFIINTAYYQDILLNRGLNGKLINNSLQTQVRIAESYAQEAGVGGSVSEYTGSIDLQPYQQMYDLNAWAKASASLDPGDKIEVRQVFYQEPPAIVRYFDPYAGTGTGVQGLLETFGFGSYSPGVNFMLMPVYWDIQKIQAIEFNDQVRKSAYSFDLVNNQLRIFPVPTDTSPARLFFKYMKVGEKYKPFTDNRDNVIADVMRVPYRNPIYADINQVGRSWIFRFTLALCKEIEGQLRASISSAIANVVTINGVELLTDSRTEKTELLAELKEYLEQTTRRSQLERRQQESDFTRQTMNQVPLLIYAF
jgi:hypothetical protein